MKKAIRLSALLLTAGLVTGCSSITVEQLEATTAIANNALAEARAAQGTANNALSVANDALSAAASAQSAADSAQSCCNANSERLDRAFSRAMSK
ncbi:MAG: Lpp/OprI family alanine-zipper lipoprotein [Gammaproteobacteria bacterium]